MDTKKLDNLDNIDINKNYNGNKLIHLIIIQNNNKLLDEYLKKNLELNLIDLNGNTPYHLLLTQFYNLETFKKLINHKVCWNNKNYSKNSIIKLILTNNFIFSELSDYHKYFMKKEVLDGDSENYNYICKYLDKKYIIEYQNIINFSHYKNPSLFEFIINKNIKNLSSLIENLIVNNKELLEIRDETGDNLLGKFITINKNNLNKEYYKKQILDLVNIGFDVDYQNPITGNNPIKFMLVYINDKDFLLKFFKNNTINFKNQDNFGNNLGIFTIFLYQKKNYSPDKLFNYIISMSDKKHKNLNNQSINSLLNLYKGNNEENEENNLDLIKVEMVNTTEFRSRFDDIIFYFMVLEKKYEKLHIPKFDTNISSKELDFDNNSFSLPTDLNIYLDMIPFFISYKNQDTYFVHPYLNLLINKLYKKNNKDYALVFLSIEDEENNLHANILLYDFSNKRIIRFEPYGNTDILDNDLDEIIEEELTWNLNFSYIKPEDYKQGSSLQALSDDNNILFQKPGDFGGFCLAWSLWFVEMFLKNSNVELSELIKKSIRKIIKKSSLVEYIRSYGDKISKEKYKIYQQIKLPKNIWSNIIFDDEYNNIIEEKILDFLNL